MVERRPRALQGMPPSKGGEMSTLALDLGSTTGYAINRNGRVESGAESFHPRKGEGDGMRYVKFRAWLVNMKTWNPDLSRIVFEEVMRHGPGQVIAAHVYGGFLATLQSFAEHHGLAYEGFGVGVIKKAWTGNGSAKKPEMIARCKALGFNPQCDNEADAIALLHVAERITATPAAPAKRIAPISTALNVDPF